jgi:hypothetical protein
MKWFAWSLCLSLLVVSYPPAFADQKVGPMLITEIFTGSDANKDLFGINTVAQINPSGQCTKAGYAIYSDQQGYRTFYAAALLAFAMRRNVEVWVDDEGCVAGWPQLIGINILSN